MLQPSPGSIISLIALSPGTHALLINLLAFVVGTASAFGIATLILLTDKKRKEVSEGLGFTITEEGISFDNNNKDDKKVSEPKTFEWKNVKNIVVACEAGMGSSAMASGIIKKWVKQHNLNINVTNVAVKDLNNTYDVVVTMNNFKEFASEKSPNALIYPIDKFMGPGIYDKLFENLKKAQLNNKE